MLFHVANAHEVRKIQEFGPFYGKDLYDKQTDDIADAMLLGGFCKPTVNSIDVDIKHRFNLLNEGEIVAGSSVSAMINSNILYSDIDIYLHSEVDAKALFALNKKYGYIVNSSTQPNRSMYVELFNTRVNLIWGIPFDNAADLISGFDIRACAVALDPINNKFYGVNGAISDCMNKRLTFQTTSRNIQLKRLLKYTQKGFQLDRYQRAIFMELAAMDKFSLELELETKDY